MQRLSQRFLRRITQSVALAALLGGMGIWQPSIAEAVTVNVVGPAGESVAGYHWVIEEDTTFHVEPGVIDPNPLAIDFHSSYMPVVASGHTPDPMPTLDPLKRYFVSVLPDAGYTIGGAPIALGQELATVTVNAFPIPTAQISVFVFEDNNAVNGVPDLPEESGLEGFSILLFEAGGRFGVSGGQVSQDAFGNPIGTTYNDDGKIVTLGDGTLTTDQDGAVLIKNLAPGKYGIQAVPPGGVPQFGAGAAWIQTSTIEGTKTIDAWVKANEPQFFVEFGPAGVHVFIGFIQPTDDTTALNGSNSISGQVVNLHGSRPPDFTFYNGRPNAASTCWVGLNDLALGVGRAVYAQRCDADNAFSIDGVPAGNYQLVVWDDFLDQIIALYNVSIDAFGTCSTPTGSCDLIEVPVFQWFSRLENTVFFDRDEDGFRDCVTAECNNTRLDDVGLQEVPVNIRFRDGTVYQSFPTDIDGFVPFDEVFPFFNWLVAEVDFGRFKATGATIIVDAGGPVEPDRGWDFPSRDQLNPQPQSEINPNTGNNLSQTETGPVLTRAFQGFAGQSSIIEWGKTTYKGTENGGISGIVYYATTRAEDDPALAAAEEWEPGIPGVEVNLYEDFDNDGRPDGARIRTTTTDSWDDSKPTGCRGDVFSLRGVPTDCYDGLRNFNQVRPGVFDGGYAFGPLVTGDGSAPLVPGTYIVEIVPPPGYEVIKEEDRNVDFGDEFLALALAFAVPPTCVGDPHLVPAELSLFPGVPSRYAGQTRKLCDRKQVRLAARSNAAADFFLFTPTPIAAHFVGFILDDLANEFDPASPNFGEKYAPPFLPISIRDFTGREFSRVYGDEFGNYNGLMHSTFTVNQPFPSGVSPQMATLCMNDPGPITDPTTGALVIDPHFNRQYSQFCYTFQFMPGTTTYLDTPVVPIAAFAGPDQFALDCELPNGTPRIFSVNGGSSGGPYISYTARTISIVSMGEVSVLNSAYDGPEGVNPKTIVRDYGFGDTQGQVKIGDRLLNITGWTNGVITATVPGPSGPNTRAESGQLTVTRGDNGESTITGLTVTVDNNRGNSTTVHTVQASTVPGATPIQDAIDVAVPGDLILVTPGSYEELVVMWKPVQLQGAGEGSTTINATRAPAEKLQEWIDKVQGLIDTAAIDLLPGQGPDGGGIPLVERGDVFATEQGPGVFVLAKATGQNRFRSQHKPRIDGFTVTAANSGGGILANGYATDLEISNNNVIGNQGYYGGGVRIGHPFLVEANGRGTQIGDAVNDNISIHNNRIAQNGSLGGAGGGVALCAGTDNYRVTGNFICGNFTQGNGGGIGHLGLSDNGEIANNTIIYNQAFNQGLSASGGGIFIGGSAPLPLGEVLTPGSGSVLINANLIQGNLAGAGDGGGLHTSRTNGQDVEQTPGNSNGWFSIEVYNNMIVNNVAGLAGGAISMQDTAKINISHNTVANNDSTATAGAAFDPGDPNASNPQPAGIVSRAHSTDLVNAFNNSTRQFFSNPALVNNIIWHNRSFSVAGDDLADPPVIGLVPDIGGGDAPVYHDLAVLGTVDPAQLDPRFSILTDSFGYHPSNIMLDPLFLAEYFNGARNAIVQVEVGTSLEIQPAFDEGGNFTDVRFGPLSLTNPDGDLPFGNYHIDLISPAAGAGTETVLGSNGLPLWQDFDGEPRPQAADPDIGSDEVNEPNNPRARPFVQRRRLRDGGSAGDRTRSGYQRRQSTSLR